MPTFLLIVQGREPGPYGSGIWEMHRSRKEIPYPRYELVRECFARAIPGKQLKGFHLEGGTCHLMFDLKVTKRQRDAFLRLLEEQIAAVG